MKPKSIDGIIHSNFECYSEFEEEEKNKVKQQLIELFMNCIKGYSKYKKENNIYDPMDEDKEAWMIKNLEELK